MRNIYTIGYEGTDIDRLVATLKAVGVKVLADVRAVAISRKKGFSKNSLRARLEAEGISYFHFVDLGDPKPGREAARAGKYDVFRKIYNDHLTTAASQAALSALREMCLVQSTCLLCFERDPITCHRSIVADCLKVKGSEVFDLFGDAPSRYDNFKIKKSHSSACKGSAAA